MAKVKKRTGVAGVRNVKADKTKTLAHGSRVKPKAAKQSPKAGRTSVRRTAKKTMTKTKRSKKPALWLVPVRKGRPAPPPPAVRVTVRALDPQRKCGAETSVQFLYRVDETVDGRATAHLVFFDRHGWYCEHGRACPAVAHARRYNGQIARVS